MSAVQARLLTHTLHGLTKLTDAANVQPMCRPPTPRSKQSDALALSIFSGPPVLPFSRFGFGLSVSVRARVRARARASQLTRTRTPTPTPTPTRTPTPTPTPTRTPTRTLTLTLT